MKIAVIGTGNIGGSLGRLWAQRGHEVLFGSRDPASARARELLAACAGRARALPLESAAAEAEVTLLAVPWHAAADTLRRIGGLKGRILVDASNPLGPDGLALGHDDSAAEQVARWAPGARVVKAFNTIGWESLGRPVIAGVQVSMPVAGDDPKAKAVVAGLVEELGFEALDAGPLQSARLLEPLALLWIRFAMSQDYGRRIGFKLLRE